jgi:CubicO group peptidase (beta-lactamase class C family)
MFPERLKVTQLEMRYSPFVMGIKELVAVSNCCFRCCWGTILFVFLALGQNAGAQQDFSTVDHLIEDAIQARQIPGAVVLVGHRGHVVYRRCYGWRSLEPTRESMTLETVFDMASLTKPLMTATAVMQLYQHGKLNPDDAVSKYLPAFGVSGKQDITIRELLTHYSGLPPDLDLTEPWETKQEAYRRAFAVKPTKPASAEFVYSDINFIVLGALVEKVSGLPLDGYSRRFIIAPLGLKHTRFLPLESWIPSIAPTQYDNGGMLRGVVHDPTARRMGGVAGHAGLFSTADDLGVFAQNFLDRLAGRPSRFPLSHRVLAKMVTPEQPSGGAAVRGFGWDIDSPYSSNRGSIFPVGSFGHTGFTGTSLWIDPSSDSYVILLSNAVHPNGGSRSIIGLRRQVADAVATALGLTAVK